MYKILILLFTIILFSGCTQPSLVKQSNVFLGTLVEISVADRNQNHASVNQAIEQAFAEISRIEDLFSKFKPSSEISRLNSQGHLQPTKVSAETISLLEQAIHFSQLSDGAFDVTIAPLLDVWQVAEGSAGKIPTSQQIDQALEKVGYQHIQIDRLKQTVYLAREGMSLDLGAIAKGYAVDQAVAVLKQQGITQALVNAGGDIYCLGWRNESQGWQVAVQHPRADNTYLVTLELSDQAVATSGDYQKYVQIAGQRFSQIIDPQSGYPRQQVPASVTVLAEDCLAADALATAIFVLGAQKGIALANRLENTEAIVASVQADQLDVLVSRGLEGKLSNE